MPTLKKSKVLILRSAGTNCDQETGFAFKSVGADVEFVHINKLSSGDRSLNDYHILALPGGFSYGDDIAAGRIFANELRLKLGDDLRRFISDGKLIIGICNGFQILVKAGLLPGESNFKQTATLMLNTSAKFEDRWVCLKPEGKSVWTKGMNGVIELPVAHGEGKFIVQNDSLLKTLKKNHQIIFRYCDESGKKPKYPQNPNGSLEDIAGITDITGRILGLMPHPERHFFVTQHPNWTREKRKSKFGDGAQIFQNGVDYVKKNLL
ncbi:MAG: phosphoribosylformylglycinamidine synthase I [Candidatus Omnitrophota bacterium]